MWAIRVGGCLLTRVNILGLLFGEHEREDIIPVRLVTRCKEKLSKKCNVFDCPRYRIGTLGGMRISWDNRGARM